LPNPRSLADRVFPAATAELNRWAALSRTRRRAVCISILEVRSPILDASRRVPPPNEYLCPHCQAPRRLRSAQAFMTVQCQRCGGEWRARCEIGGYWLHEPLARSGFAIIFRAETPADAAPIAVKVISPPSGCEPGDFERFAANVSTLTAFEHPHWLRILDGGIADDLPWLAMEWLPLGSLADRGRLTEIEALEFAAQAASALAAAREAGLRHPSLHPADVLFADAQTLKISGFAEAVFHERAASATGTVLGRLCCASPERFLEIAEDERTDIYALGITLFQAVTGALPYDGAVLPEHFGERIGSAPLRVREVAPTITTTTAGIIERMCALDPAERFQSWADVVESLGDASATLVRATARARPRATVSGSPVRTLAPVVRTSPRGGAWWTLAMLAALAAFVGWFGWKKWHAPEGPIAATKPAPAAAPEPPRATPPLAPVSTLPPPAPAPKSAAAAPPPEEPPARKPATPAPTMDWTGWKRAILLSPTKPAKVAGDAAFPGGFSLRLSGNSTGIDGRHDEMIFYWRNMEGDWSLKARMLSNRATAGLSARSGMNSGDLCIAVLHTHDGKVKSAVRSEAETAAKVEPPAPAPPSAWLKIERQGATIATFVSGDGSDWQKVGSIDAATWPAKTPVGFVAWSGKNQPTGATFAEVKCGGTTTD
jgi:hypothetical protein